jgi:eukaryotic-like serine/threonine-protein kinase
VRARAITAAAPESPAVAGTARAAESSAALKPRKKSPGVALYLGPGQKIADRYEIIEVLGEGGMGVVYACRDRSGEVCAVKRVVLPESNPDEHLAWFVAEAQALAALSHPNIVRARDFGQLRDGTPYLAMDLVDGVLWQQISSEAANFSLLWRLVDQVLAALAHAHARGIVHGDLKPSNVVVDLDEAGLPRARLFDFGLAKRRRSELDPRFVDRSVTREPPASAGTPGYMAPEQILGRTSEISGATDLYALGCILYRVLAGRPLALKDTRKDADFHAFEEPPRPPPLPGVSESLVDFVLSLLVLKPWRRLASASEARAAWQAFRPRAERQGPGGIAALLVKAVEVPVKLERTCRVGPSPGRAARARLARSRRFLPGLLSVRESPLVGRADLQGLLQAICSDVARPGEPGQRAVLVTGPAGVGKSRLLAWLCTEVEERGAALALRGFRHAGGAPRDPLALALFDRFAIGRGALRMLPSEILDQCEQADVGAVVDWVLRSHRPEVFGAAEAETLAPRLIRVLGAVARGRPLLLWLDDLAAITPVAWSVLLRAPELDPRLRFVLATTSRAEALEEPALGRTARALDAALPTEYVRVPPLDPLTTAELIRAAHPIEPALALKLALESDGIPLAALTRLYAVATRAEAR